MKESTRVAIAEFKQYRTELRLEYATKIERVNVKYDKYKITWEVRCEQVGALNAEYKQKLNERLEQLKRDCPEIDPNTTSDNI